MQDDNILDISITRFISKEAIENSATKLCPKNTICVVTRVGVGKVAVTKNEVCTSQDFFNITKTIENPLFLAHLLQLKLKNITSQGTSIKGITSDSMKEMQLYLPELSEQSKIAEFLTLINARIETQNKIIEDLKTYKKGIYQRIFKKIETHNVIQLSKILVDFNEKVDAECPYPILSSTLSGLFFQDDYFNKRTASENTEGYKIVPRNYATYRSMSDTGEFRFNLQELTDFGIVSPAYPVFTCNETFLIEYVLLCLNYSNEIKKGLKIIKQGGTRFALHFASLCLMFIPNITLDLQGKIVQLSKVIESKIMHEESVLEKYKEQKKFLLSNMFI